MSGSASEKVVKEGAMALSVHVSTKLIHGSSEPSGLGDGDAVHTHALLQFLAFEDVWLATLPTTPLHTLTPWSCCF